MGGGSGLVSGGHRAGEPQMPGSQYSDSPPVRCGLYSVWFHCGSHCHHSREEEEEDRESLVDGGVEAGDGKTDRRTRTMSETSQMSQALDRAESISKRKYTGRLDELRGMEARRGSSHQEEHR